MPQQTYATAVAEDNNSDQPTSYSTAVEEKPSLYRTALDKIFTVPEPLRRIFDTHAKTYDEKTAPDDAMRVKIAQEGYPVDYPTDVPAKTLEGMATPGDVALMLGTGGEGLIPKLGRGVAKVASGLLALKGAGELYNAKDIPSGVQGALETGMGALGLKHPINIPEALRGSKELPIRRPRELPSATFHATPEGEITRGMPIDYKPKYDPFAPVNKTEELPIKEGEVIPETATEPSDAPVSYKTAEAISDVPEIKEEPKKFINPFLKKEEAKTPDVLPEGHLTAEEVTSEMGVSPEEALQKGWVTAEGDNFKRVQAGNLKDDLAILKDKIEVPGNTIDVPKKEYTIENAPPNQRAKMFRGTYEPVEVLFTSPEDREMFSAGQKAFKAGEIKPGILDKLKFVSEKVAKDYELDPIEARKAISDYGAEIRRLGKEQPEEGGNFTAPSFEDFIKNRKNPEDAPGIVEMQGGLGAIKPPKRVRNPFKGVAGDTLNKVFNNMQASKEAVVQQEVVNKAERAKRFAAFEGVDRNDPDWARKALGKMKGEFEKVDAAPHLQLNDNDVRTLHSAIDKSKLSTPEKVHAMIAMNKFVSGDRLVRSELSLLDDIFGNEFSNRILELHGGLGATTRINLVKASNTSKVLMSTADLSAPLRQGAGLVHKAEWREAFGEMFKYLGNKQYYNDAMQAIENRPNYVLGREAGLFTSKHEALTSAEEAFGNNYIDHIPGVRDVVGASERAYTGFLNKLRSDVFDNLLNDAKAAGYEPFKITTSIDPVTGQKATIREANEITKNIAKFINNATGRGSLGALERMGPELNAVFWSPRLLSSRLTALNPAYYYKLDPFTRKEAIKSLFGIAGMSATFNALYTAAGATAAYKLKDMASADFAKSRFGNIVMDPNAGYQQPIVAAARVIKEMNRIITSEKKNFNDPNIPEIVGRFLANKEGPFVSLIHDLISSRAITGAANPSEKAPLGIPQFGGYTDQYGNKKFINTEIMKRFVPLFTQDIYDLIKDDKDFASRLGLGAAASLGQGVQDYPERSVKPKIGIGRMRPMRIQ